MDPDALTDDRILGGRVVLRQPAHGYRVAIDPVLLAAAVPAGEGDHVLDAGAGTGAAALCLAKRVPACRVDGLEIQPSLQETAVANVAHNNLTERVEMILGDLARPPSRLIGSFDHVMTNPPYHAAQAACPSPQPERAQAHLEGNLPLARWLQCCLRLLKPRGTLTLIHRADRLSEALAALRDAVGGLVIFPFWPGHGVRPAKRVILQGRKGVRASEALMPGLVLHEPGGGFTIGAEAVLRHAEPLVLGVRSSK
ncbi:MAG: methyltransferase [Pseudomonadota bacterium]